MRCSSFTSVGGEKEEFSSGHFVLRTGCAGGEIPPRHAPRQDESPAYCGAV